MKDGEIKFCKSANSVNRIKTYKLNVDNEDLVFNMLVNDGHNVQKDKEGIIIKGCEAIIPDIVKRICLSGVKIFSLIPQKDSLESMFLRYK